MVGNIEEIIVCRQAPAGDNLLRGEGIRSGEPKRRVGVNYEPERVVLLVRTYEEADKAGNTLEGFNNNACAYYHLPLLCASPMDYYLSKHVLGHVRLAEVKKIGSGRAKREVTGAGAVIRP